MVDKAALLWRLEAMLFMDQDAADFIQKLRQIILTKEVYFVLAVIGGGFATQSIWFFQTSVMDAMSIRSLLWIESTLLIPFIGAKRRFGKKPIHRVSHLWLYSYLFLVVGSGITFWSCTIMPYPEAMADYATWFIRLKWTLISYGIFAFVRWICMDLRRVTWAMVWQIVFYTWVELIFSTSSDSLVISTKLLMLLMTAGLSLFIKSVLELGFEFFWRDKHESKSTIH